MQLVVSMGRRVLLPGSKTQGQGGERCCFPEVLQPDASVAGADTSLLALRWL